MATRTASPGVLEIPPLEIKRVRLRVVGLSELITHNWSEKALDEIEGKQAGKAKGKKAPKVPEEEYEAAFHRLPDGRPAFPSSGFKAAAVNAASFLDGPTKVFLRGAFFVTGELVPIDGTPRMRRDPVKIGMGTTDLRYRPGFPEWSAWVPIEYDPSCITLEQLVHLFKHAGSKVGLGEWRPQKNGQFGRFDVDIVQEVD